MWSRPSAVSENIASLRKLYKSMMEAGVTVSAGDSFLLGEIKANCIEWISQYEDSW